MNKRKFHFSVDDVFDSLIEVSDKNIPLKEHYFFRELYFLWKKYKISTGLHLFYKKKVNGKIRTLKDVRPLTSELKDKWIYFNIHALSPNKPPFKQRKEDQKKTFNKIYKEIFRFAGKKYLTNYIRLHYYSESYELSNYFKSKKISGLFSTDRNIGSHRMPKSVSKNLLNKNVAKYKNLNFIRTNFRVEWLTNLKKKKIKEEFSNFFNDKRVLIIYSHEYEFKKKKVRETLRKASSVLTKGLKAKSIKP